jgi:hypothetical protein
MKQNKSLSEDAQKALDFIRRMGGCHGYAKDAQTRRAIKELKKRNLIETNEFSQFWPKAGA